MWARTCAACSFNFVDARDVVGSFERFQIPLQRYFRVDDDPLAEGQVNDQVGTKPSLVGVGVALLMEIAALDHTREFDDPLELDLAPAAAALRRAQRVHQLSGFRAQSVLPFRHRLDLFRKDQVRARARFFELLNLPVDVAQRFAQRFHQLLDSGLPAVEIAFRFRLMLFEGLLCQIKKCAVVALQSLRGKGAKG